MPRPPSRSPLSGTVPNLARCVGLSLFLTVTSAVAAPPQEAPKPAAIPAFPGAEGFGALTPGGRGGRILRVTTLDDYSPGGRDPVIPGSLRWAIDQPGPRIVVFAVAGLIDLKAPLVVREPRLSVLGQSAPGDGVCLRRHPLIVRADHVILRHLRSRPGDLEGRPSDGLSVLDARDVVIDHCSISWSTDEALSVTGETTTRISVQWCLIAESLNRSVHEKGAHGYASLIRTGGDVSFHHNLYAHHVTRCPRPGTYGERRAQLLDFRHNTVYDWHRHAGYSASDPADMNYVGNSLRPGPTTATTATAFRFGGPTRAHFAGNAFEGRPQVDRDNWLAVADAGLGQRMPLPFAAPAPAEPGDARAASIKVLRDAGATLPRRDAVDRRIVEQVEQRRGRIIDSQREVGGWPEYRKAAVPAEADADGDAIPDEWERLRGLKPTDPSDAARLAPTGYAWIEEYLHSLVRPAAGD